MSQVFKDFINKSNEDKSHKRMIREQNPRIRDDRIIIVDTSMMAVEQVAYIEQRRAEIIQIKTFLINIVICLLFPHYIDLKN